MLILGEQDKTYAARDYFDTCKQLDLFPLKHRLKLFAILLFRKIIHQQINIKLPTYIRIVPPSNLRTSHRDPLTFKSSITPIIAKKKSKKFNNITIIIIKTRNVIIKSPNETRSSIIFLNIK